MTGSANSIDRYASAVEIARYPPLRLLTDSLEGAIREAAAGVAVLTSRGVVDQLGLGMDSPISLANTIRQVSDIAEIASVMHLARRRTSDAEIVGSITRLGSAAPFALWEAINSYEQPAPVDRRTSYANRIEEIAKQVRRQLPELTDVEAREVAQRFSQLYLFLFFIQTISVSFDSKYLLDSIEVLLLDPSSTVEVIVSSQILSEFLRLEQGDK